MQDAQDSPEADAREMLDALDALISKHVVDRGSVELGWMMRGLLDQLAGDPLLGDAGCYRGSYSQGCAAADAIRAAHGKEG
jgi:hypothetical protein